MRRLTGWGVAVICLLGWVVAAGAQENPMLGVWTVNDPNTGKEEQLTFTADHMTFGSEQRPIPYRFERRGDNITIFLGNQDSAPGTFTVIDETHAELFVPGGPPVALTRVAAAPAAPASSGQAAASGPPNDLMDEITKALVPYGVQTRYEPLERSLEQLLSEGWKLDQAAGAQGGFTILLTKGSMHALCVLVPQNLGQAATALSDCRRLN